MGRRRHGPGGRQKSALFEYRGERLHHESPKHRPLSPGPLQPYTSSPSLPGQHGHISVLPWALGSLCYSVTSGTTLTRRVSKPRRTSRARLCCVRTASYTSSARRDAVPLISSTTSPAFSPALRGEHA